MTTPEENKPEESELEESELDELQFTKVQYEQIMGKLEYIETFLPKNEIGLETITEEYPESMPINKERKVWKIVIITILFWGFQTMIQLLVCTLWMIFWMKEASIVRVVYIDIFIFAIQFIGSLLYILIMCTLYCTAIYRYVQCILTKCRLKKQRYKEIAE